MNNRLVYTLLVLTVAFSILLLPGCEYLDDVIALAGLIYVILDNTSEDRPGDEQKTEDPDIEVEEEAPCQCSGEGGLARITIRAGTSLTPNPQYCFIRLRGGVNWVSAPQAFGPGANILEFSNMPTIDADCELLACVTADYAIAASGNSDAVAFLSKSYISGIIAAEWKSTNIEYDCMSGYDIQGGVNAQGCSELQIYVEMKYRSAKICPIVEPDEINIPPQIYTSWESLHLFILEHWELKFDQYKDDPSWAFDFGVMAIQTCANRQSYPYPLEDDAIGWTLSYPGQSNGKRGAATLIFVQDVRNLIADADELEACHWDVAHEFGHLIGGVSDYTACPNCHSSGNCLMNNISFDQYYRLVDQTNRFCGRCNSNLKAHSWL